jgi:hypothetical protein
MLKERLEEMTNNMKMYFDTCLRKEIEAAFA